MNRKEAITEASRIRSPSLSTGPPSPAAMPPIDGVGAKLTKGGDLVPVPGDLKWKSGTGFIATLLHAITAARNYIFPDVTGNVPVLPTAATTETGTGAVVRATSPTIATPVIADLTNVQHTHQSVAGGGSLNAGAVTAGTLADARLSANVPLKDAGNSFSVIQTFPAGFIPRYFNCTFGALTTQSGELSIWHDSAGGLTYLVYNDQGVANRIVQLV